MAASNPKHVAVLSEICLYNKVVLDQNLNIYVVRQESNETGAIFFI
jgi:hypothetical protein